MKTSNRKGILISLSIALVLCVITPAFSKDKVITPGYLEVFGKVKNGNEMAVDATINVFHEGVKVDEYTPDAKGKFDLKLALNRTFYLHFSKAGMITKIIKVDTGIPDSADFHCAFEYKFNVSLAPDFLGCNNMDMLKVPSEIIVYNKDYDGFDYDRVYDHKMHDQIIISLSEQEKIVPSSFEAILTKK